MKKQVNSFGIGNGKRLVLEHDPENIHEEEFIKECQQVSDTKPASLQDSFTTLATIQRKKHERFIAQEEDDKQTGLKKLK